MWDKIKTRDMRSVIYFILRKYYTFNLFRIYIMMLSDDMKWLEYKFKAIKLRKLIKKYTL